MENSGRCRKIPEVQELPMDAGSSIWRWSGTGMHIIDAQPHACAWMGCGTFCHEMFLMAPLAHAMSHRHSLAQFFSQDHLCSLMPTYTMRMFSIQ